jgi:predicted N-acyltransferase
MDAIADFVDHEAKGIEHYMEILEEHLPYKKTT